MKLSVIVPVYNEKDTIRRILEHIRSVPVDKEIVLVDDGSTDGTRETIVANYRDGDGLKIIFHDKNRGKGAAIRTGIREASGDAIIIQDADLEYDPNDYIALLEALRSGPADVVYGSRFLKNGRVTSPFHRFVNYFLTLLTNLLYGSRLTDMETCYKLFRSGVLRKLELNSEGFEIEVELTAKTLLAKQNIREVPIAYKGRSFHEGKKIGWTDGLKAVRSLLWYRFGGR